MICPLSSFEKMIILALISYSSFYSSEAMQATSYSTTEHKIPTQSHSKTAIIPTVSPNPTRSSTKEPTISPQLSQSIQTPEPTATEQIITSPTVGARVYELYVYITIAVVAFVVLAIVFSYYCVIKKRRDRKGSSNTAFSDYIMQPSDQFFD